jgi:hypothetical protein
MGKVGKTIMLTPSRQKHTLRCVPAQCTHRCPTDSEQYQEQPRIGMTRHATSIEARQPPKQLSKCAPRRTLRYLAQISLGVALDARHVYSVTLAHFLKLQKGIKQQYK